MPERPRSTGAAFLLRPSISVVPCVDQHCQHAQHDDAKCHETGDKNGVVHGAAILQPAAYYRSTSMGALKP